MHALHLLSLWQCCTSFKSDSETSNIGWVHWVDNQNWVSTVVVNLKVRNCSNEIIVWSNFKDAVRDWFTAENNSCSERNFLYPVIIEIYINSVKCGPNERSRETGILKGDSKGVSSLETVLSRSASKGHMEVRLMQASV